MCDNDSNKRNHMYLKSDTSSGHKRATWKEWELQDGQKSRLKRPDIRIKLLCCYLKKDIWVPSLWRFTAQWLRYKAQIAFPTPASTLNVSEVWIVLPTSCIPEVGLLRKSWTPTSPFGQWGKAWPCTDEILWSALGEGLACGWPMLKAYNGSNNPTSLGKGGVSVQMRQLPLSTYVCDGRLDKLSSLACHVWFVWDWVLAWRELRLFTIANKPLQSIDRIMALSQSL